MAIQETRTLPAQFIEDLGKDLAKQVTAQSGVPVVATGLAGISQQPGETAADFQARQQAAREFTTSTNSSNTSFWIRNTGSWAVRWSRNWSTSISTRRTRFYVPFSISSY